MIVHCGSCGPFALCTYKARGMDCCLIYSIAGVHYCLIWQEYIWASYAYWTRVIKGHLHMDILLEEDNLVIFIDYLFGLLRFALSSCNVA